MGADSLTEQLAALWRWLEGTPLSRFMRENIWAYPFSEIAHIFGLALLVGGAVVWDLRLLGFSRQVPVTTMMRHALRVSVFGFIVAVISGVMLFSTSPAEMAANSAFQLKMVLLAAAGLNALVFRVGVGRHVAAWDADTGAPGMARIAAVLSLALWFLVIACGRLIAYV